MIALDRLVGSEAVTVEEQRVTARVDGAGQGRQALSDAIGKKPLPKPIT